jgi:hypothetical protein
MSLSPAPSNPRPTTNLHLAIMPEAVAAVNLRHLYNPFLGF